MQDVLDSIINDFHKQIMKIKPFKKMFKFNNKYSDLLFKNSELTELGCFLCFFEAYVFFECLSR